MKTARAIVVVFIGEPTNEIVRGNIVHALRECNAKEVDIIELDRTDIANAIVNPLNPEKPRAEIVELENHTPEDEAVILIGTVMKNELTHFNTSTFTAALAAKIADASIHPELEENKSFMNALFILSKDELLISQALMRKYKLNAQRINLIKRLYNCFKTF